MTSTELGDTFTRRLFPTGYCKELKGLFKLSWPIIITMIFQFSLQPLAVIFCGRLGKTELDAVALANSLINVTGISVANGLATACDTLYSQTYGSKNKYKLGICLQRALLVIVLGIFPCWAIHLNTESILLLFGQDAQVSRLTARYLLIFMPGLLGFFLYVPLAKYIQNQNIVLPTMVIALVPNMVTVVMHYFMVTVCGMGTDGSAVAQAVSYLTFLPLILGYIYFSKLYKNTWNGWSWECLEHWGLFFRLSIAGLFHISIEWWSFEIGTFLTGVLGTTELGAQSLLMNIETITFMFPVGIGVSASIRVGQYLGSGSGDGAKSAYRTALTITWMVTLTITILLMSLANYIPLIFTDVREVVDLASRLLPVLGIYMVFDGTCGLSTGVLRGSGRQHVGVAVVVIGYLVLGLPIGIPLMFLTPLGISGWWWALAGALLIDSIIYTVILYFTNWERQAELAQKRVTINCASRQDQEETTALLGEQQKDYVNNCKDVIPKRPSVPIPPRKVSTLLPDSQFNMEHNLLEVSTKSRTQLLLQRLAVFILMICVLIFGILCRVFVPTQNKGLVEAFDCNDTSIIGTRT